MLIAGELESTRVIFNEETANTQMFADPHHFKQIFLNLFKNSINAMAGDGEIKIDVKSQAGIKIIFADNGCGISLPDRLSHQ